MFPPFEKQVRSLIRILSMRVADFEVTRVGCRIRGLKPDDEIKS